jgi:hypothetical protein
MNGPEFFMQHAGYRLLDPARRTSDPVIDADILFGISLPLNTGKVLRLSSCWMVITPDWVATSFKAVSDAGFRADMERKDAIRDALKSGGPCMLLALGKRTMAARDLFVTYDPRAARLCSPGEVKTFDATQEKTWTS